MALLHMRRTLTNGGSDDMVAADELNGDASSPRHSLEVVGVQGRVHEMVLRFSVLNFDESTKKVDQSLRSPTSTNGLVSPTGTTVSGRSWRRPSPSPVHAYRSGWLPPGKPASRDTETSPVSPRPYPHHQHGQTDASPTASCTSRVNFSVLKSDQPSESSSSVLKIDLTADDKQDVKSQHSSEFAISNGHVDSSVVNGWSESAVTSSSSPDQCDGLSRVVAGSDDEKWAEKLNNSTSVDAIRVVPKSSSSFPAVDTSPVANATLPAIPDRSDAYHSSLKLSNSVATAAADKDRTVVSDDSSSACSEVARQGVDSLPHDDAVIVPCCSGPDAELVRQHGPEVETFTITDVTQQDTQRLHSTDGDVDDAKGASRDSVVMPLPSDTSDVHRDSDQLLSARRTSVDYFQKDGRYFLVLVQSVEERINALCVQAEADMNCAVPEEVLGKLRATVGKAHLLTSKKFRQFRDLCERNLTQSGEEQFQTTSQDLAGFWDLVMIQVDDVRLMFAEIEQLRQNAWKELLPQETLTVPLSPITKHMHSCTSPLSASKRASYTVKSKTGHSRDAKTGHGRDPAVKADAAKAREEARKRLLAAKAAGRQRKASENDAGDVQIYIS